MQYCKKAKSAFDVGGLPYIQKCISISNGIFKENGGFERIMSKFFFKIMPLSKVRWLIFDGDRSFTSIFIFEIFNLSTSYSEPDIATWFLMISEINSPEPQAGSKKRLAFFVPELCYP